MSDTRAGVEHRRAKTRRTPGETVWWCKVPQCTKVCYVSKRDAKIELRRHPHWDQAMVAYRCRDCEFVHLGHQPYAVIMGACTATEWYEVLTDDERSLLSAVLRTQPDRWFQEGATA